jgi:tetratricopeptide (TPR) repeat protein
MRWWLVPLMVVASIGSQAAHGQGARPELRRTQAQLLYEFAAAQVAADQITDTKLFTLRKRVEALQAELKSKQASAANDIQALRTTIAALQENFVAQLESRDRESEQLIAAFRGAITQIAMTPQGEAVLQRYAAGERTDALRELDVLIEARAKARQVQTDLETAADLRASATLALRSRTLGELNTEKVIARFERVTRLDPGFHRDWIELARLYTDAGRLEDARRAAELSAKTARDPRSRLAASNELGSVLVTAGQLPLARSRYEESVTIAQQLVETSAGDQSALRDLSVAREKLGDVLLWTMDTKAAQAHYEGSLSIRQQLAARNPTDVAKYDLSMGLIKLGDVLFVSAKPAEARVRYEAGLGLANELAESERATTSNGCGGVATRHVSASLARLGNALMMLRSFGEARRRFEASLAIDQQLAACDPGSASAKRDLSVSLSKVGDVLVAAGEVGPAAERYAASLAIRRQIASANPTSAAAERDVVVTMEKLARLPGTAVRWRDVADALRAMEQRGVLFPADRELLTEALRRAAAEER